mmetsp:Transcript_29446/g.77441  ORF Transcript_29446/g.77441 Transcript_29446/m.77441 type:complete len:220 (+) Transcript_29446:1696-2355(+)
MPPCSGAWVRSRACNLARRGLVERTCMTGARRTKGVLWRKGRGQRKAVTEVRVQPMGACVWESGRGWRRRRARPKRLLREWHLRQQQPRAWEDGVVRRARNSELCLRSSAAQFGRLAQTLLVSRMPPSLLPRGRPAGWLGPKRGWSHSMTRTKPSEAGSRVREPRGLTRMGGWARMPGRGAWRRRCGGPVAWASCVWRARSRAARWWITLFSRFLPRRH